jgi:hypothetical protein
VRTLVPIYAVTGFVIGYLVGGVGAAICVGILMALSAALGAWIFTRRFDKP